MEAPKSPGRIHPPALAPGPLDLWTGLLGLVSRSVTIAAQPRNHNVIFLAEFLGISVLTAWRITLISFLRAVVSSPPPRGQPLAAAYTAAASNRRCAVLDMRIDRLPLLACRQAARNYLSEVPCLACEGVQTPAPSASLDKDDLAFVRRQDAAKDTIRGHGCRRLVIFSA